MGRRRKRIRQEQLWRPTEALPVSASHPFYQKLNQLLEERHFDEVVEMMCEGFYAETMGRPGLAPGIYFRLLMVGYFGRHRFGARHRLARQRQFVDPFVCADRAG